MNKAKLMNERNIVAIKQDLELKINGMIFS